MNNEAMRKNNLGLHIPVFGSLIGFIVINIYNLFMKDSTAALWLSGISLTAFAIMLSVYTAVFIKENKRSKN